MEKYDPIAEGYATYKGGPYVHYVEKPCFLQIIGSLKGLSVLEVGCGDGFYCREFVKLGATEVVGVDLSKEMLQIANESEAKNPLGIKYIEGDSRKMAELGEFDVVCAAYLLNDMNTREEIRDTCLSLARNLKKGGKLVGLLYYAKELDSADYKGEEPVKQPFTFRDANGKPMSETIDTVFRKTTYGEIFNSVGFDEVNWRPFEITEKGLAECGTDYFEWERVRTNPAQAFWARKRE